VEYIQEALNKARASAPRLANRVLETPPRIQVATARAFVPPPPEPEVLAPWTPNRVTLDERHLESERIISFAMKDSNHHAFNLLRTRVRRECKDHGWRSVAITSPTAGCGKTMVTLNLAFSLARAPDCRVVVVDLDLRKPAVARTLGIRTGGSISRYLDGRLEVEECFVQVNNNLIVGVSNLPVMHSSDMMQSPKMADLISTITARLSPDVILFDLPPMSTGDDALGFLPKSDATLLVIAAGVTTAAQVDECERQITQTQNLLGVVLNKCEGRVEEYYS